MSDDSQFPWVRDRGWRIAPDPARLTAATKHRNARYAKTRPKEPTIMQLAVKDIKKGDRFDRPGGWTALADAQYHNGVVSLMVSYSADGSRSPREWDDPTHVLEITRDPVSTIPA